MLCNKYRDEWRDVLCVNTDDVYELTMVRCNM